MNWRLLFFRSVGGHAFADFRPLRGRAIAGFALEPTGDETCPGRQEFADDHILLQTIERIGGRANSGAGQHLDGVLERGRREPRVCA